MRRETVIKHVHICGATCETRGKSLWCPSCSVPVTDPNLMIRWDSYTDDPEPPRAA